MSEVSTLQAVNVVILAAGRARAVDGLARVGAPPVTGVMRSVNERSAHYEFRRIEPTDAYLERCARMLMEVFPHGTYSAESLRWQYRDNPAGTVVGHDAIAPDGTIAGHYVLQPLVARVDGVVERGLLSFNTATHPAHQGKGLFTALAERSYTAAASSGYGFVVGVANANSTPGFTRRLGFTLVCALQALVGVRLRTDESRSAQFERTWDDASAAWRAARPNARYRSVGDALYAATPTTGIRALLAHGPLFAPACCRRAWAAADRSVDRARAGPAAGGDSRAGPVSAFAAEFDLARSYDEGSETRSGSRAVPRRGFRSVLMEAALFVFAHQDDEVGAASRIAWERTRNAEVWCVYLTDGARSTPAVVRDAESLAVLTRLGVVRSHVVAIGDAAGRIPDGELMTQLDRAGAALRLWIEQTGIVFDRLYTLDWEGGHPDHDAACAVALAVAPDAGIRDVFSFPMYNGFRRRRGWFRVASPVPAPGTLDIRRRMSFREALGIARCVFAYPSQRRTWLGLGPGFVVRTLFPSNRSRSPRRCLPLAQPPARRGIAL